MIKTTKIQFPLSSNDLSLFKNKLIHIVCQAEKKEESYCSQYLKTCDFPTEKANEYIDEVNKKNEIGCLYPKCNLSLIPNIDITTNLTSKLAEIDSYLTDVIINANELYFKCDTILFAFEKSNSPESSVMHQILKTFLKKHDNKIKHLNTILTNLE